MHRRLLIIFNQGLEFLKKYWYFIVIGLIFAFALSFRLETYLFNRQLWYDEAALASNFFEHSGFFWVFKHLNHCQMAPPLFLACVKFLISVFGKSDIVFRFLPFLSSILSVFVFYKLSKTFLKSKAAIILANFLFAVNFSLIFYGSEFKQYSSDVLIFMLVLLWLSKQNLENITYKKVLAYNFLFTLFFLISQPTIFLLFGFLIFNIIKNYKNSKIYLIPILPLIIVLTYKISMPQELVMGMKQYWQFAFISNDTFLNIIKENLNFFFLHIKCLKFLSPFIFIGFIIFIFKNKTNIARILLFSLLGALFANILHIYPLVQRLILFTFPFIIIFISYCIDFKIPSKKFNNIILITIVFFVLLFLCLFQAKAICKDRTNMTFGLISARNIALILKDNFDNKKDILLVPSSNRIYYNFYANILGLNIGKGSIVEFEEAAALNKTLNAINKNKDCWIFLTSCFSTKSIEPYVKKELETNKDLLVIYKIEFTSLKNYPSYLYKIMFIK